MRTYRVDYLDAIMNPTLIKREYILATSEEEARAYAEVLKPIGTKGIECMVVGVSCA